MYTKEIEERGWIELKGKMSDDELMIFAESLGEILQHPNGKIIDIITPKNPDQAIENSLSYRFGYNSFPLHSDTAFWTKPARYVLLSSENISKTATTIITFQSIIEKFTKHDLVNLEQAIYLVKIKNKTFYAKFKQQFGNDYCLRYDSSTMKPLNKYAKELELRLSEIFQTLNINKIEWDSNKVLILDNWKTLHGRDAIQEDLNRKLKRIYIQ